MFDYKLYNTLYLSKINYIKLLKEYISSNKKEEMILNIKNNENITHDEKILIYRFISYVVTENKLFIRKVTQISIKLLSLLILFGPCYYYQ